MRTARNTKFIPTLTGCKCGFMLMELLVAISLLAILAGIAYPSYGDAVRKARRAEGRSALMQLMQQQERFYSQHNRYAEFSSSTVAAQGAVGVRFKWFSGDSAKTSVYELSAKACDDSTLADCVLLIARPGTDKVKRGFEDPECGALTLTSTGVKGSSGTHGTHGHCW